MIALFEHMGCTNPAVQILVNKYGIKSLDKLGLLTNCEIDSLLKLVRSLGGQILNLNAVGAGQPALISPPKHMQYGCYAKRQVSRAYDLAFQTNLTTTNFWSRNSSLDSWITRVTTKREWLFYPNRRWKAQYLAQELE